VSEAASPRRGRKTKEKHNIEDRGKVCKVFKNIKYPRERRADIKIERIASSERVGELESLEIKGRGESDSDEETELRDRRGGRW